MKLAIPSFQFRFVPSMGNVVYPGNFHPVGTQVAAEAMLERAGSAPEGSKGENWLVVGGSGGFGSARIISKYEFELNVHLCYYMQ